RTLKEGKSSVAVKRESYQRYNDALDKEALKLVLMSAQGGMERNYYVNQRHNRLQVNAPWYSPDFHRMCTEIEWDDLQVA
ncbi:MAG TPA: hypothetical protein VL899_10155, partial [Alphaproteobacteria bacterium]|nr:hypothetical protein [Alphaproteobacteria bacterium]